MRSRSARRLVARGSALGGARGASGLALGGALLLQVELVARGAGAEDEAEEHADHQRPGNEQHVARGHDFAPAGLASSAAASRSWRRWAISRTSACWRRHRNSTKPAAMIHIAAYA